MGKYEDLEFFKKFTYNDFEISKFLTIVYYPI